MTLEMKKKAKTQQKKKESNVKRKKQKKNGEKKGLKLHFNANFFSVRLCAREERLKFVSN